MKLLFIFIFIINSAYSKGNYSNEIFTINQKKLIIEAIDNLCADSWCESEYDFEFKDFTCKKSTKTCGLSFYMIYSENMKRSYIKKCHFFNITKIEQVLKDKTLNDHFYQVLDRCFSNQIDQEERASIKF